MKNKFRVAVVGCGAISGNHIGGILEAGEAVCAFCDIDLEKAKKQAAKFGLENIPVYTDYSEMLREEHPDIVHICTDGDRSAGKGHSRPMRKAALYQP